MPAARTDDVAHLRISIDEIIRLADIELPIAAELGRDALNCDSRPDAVDLLDRMHAHAADANCEYLAELVDLALRQLYDSAGE